MKEDLNAAAAGLTLLVFPCTAGSATSGAGLPFVNGVRRALARDGQDRLFYRGPLSKVANGVRRNVRLLFCDGTLTRRTRPADAVRPASRAVA